MASKLPITLTETIIPISPVILSRYITKTTTKEEEDQIKRHWLRRTMEIIIDIPEQIALTGISAWNDNSRLEIIDDLVNYYETM